MGTQKMSLANIQGKLSRSEMKKIMAGSGDTPNCSISSQCSLYANGTTYYGYCGYTDYLNACECITSYGDYTPSGGTSHCSPPL